MTDTRVKFSNVADYWNSLDSDERESLLSKFHIVPTLKNEGYGDLPGPIRVMITLVWNSEVKKKYFPC